MTAQAPTRQELLDEFERLCEHMTERQLLALCEFLQAFLDN